MLHLNGNEHAYVQKKNREIQIKLRRKNEEIWAKIVNGNIML